MLDFARSLIIPPRAIRSLGLAALVAILIAGAAPTEARPISTPAHPTPTSPALDDPAPDDPAPDDPFPPWEEEDLPSNFELPDDLSGGMP